MYTRRHFGRVALGALPVSSAPGKIGSKLHAVQCGLQCCVFYGLPSNLDTVIASMVETGLGKCGIFSLPAAPAEFLEKQPGAAGTAAAARPALAYRCARGLPNGARWRRSTTSRGPGLEASFA